MISWNKHEQLKAHKVILKKERYKLLISHEDCCYFDPLVKTALEESEFAGLVVPALIVHWQHQYYWLPPPLFYSRLFLFPQLPSSPQASSLVLSLLSDVVLFLWLLNLFQVLCRGRPNSDFHFPSYRYIFWLRILLIVNLSASFSALRPTMAFFREHYVPEFKERLLSNSAIIWESIRPAFTT